MAKLTQTERRALEQKARELGISGEIIPWGRIIALKLNHQPRIKLGRTVQEAGITLNQLAAYQR